MGPEAATRFPGQRLVRALPPADGARPAERATPARAAGRRGTGDICGALIPATGDARTAPAGRRTSATWVDCRFREQVAPWVPAAAERVSASLDNLSVQRATAVLLFSRAHPCGEFVCPPTDAASRTLSAPWGKALRALARTGRRCATWEDVCAAVAAATTYWHAHRHPVIWGRRRHQPRRRAGIGLAPKAA